MKIKNLLTTLSLIFALLFCMAFACENGSDESGRTQTRTDSSQTEPSTEDEQSSTNYQDTESPRLGSYQVLSYGANPNNPILLGHFDLLAGGKYKFYNNGGSLAGEGNYAFDSASNNVQWSGIFKSNGWGGTFEVSREGKTHLIRLTRTTIGTNSNRFRIEN